MRARLLLLGAVMCGTSSAWNPSILPAQTALGLRKSADSSVLRATFGRSLVQIAAKPRFGPLAMSADDLDMSAFFAEVDNRKGTSNGPQTAVSGAELKQIVMDKWKYPLEVRIHRRRDAFGKMTVWLQVMWKHLWEKSFPMSEGEYNDQLDAVAWYISEWQLSDYVRRELKETSQNPGLTVNGGAKTVLISLPVSPAQMKMMYDDADA